MLNQFLTINFSAQQIYEQIKKYLLIQKDKFPQEYLEKDVNVLLINIKKGTCNGLVSLWVYYLLQNEEQKFLDLLSFICTWKGIGADLEINKNYSINFELFINHIMWLQKDFKILFKHVPQYHLHQQLNFLTMKEQVKNPFKIGFVFTEAELLTTLEAIKTSLPVVFRNSEHVVAFVKANDKITFYNPNIPSGFILAKNNHDLVRLIRKALFLDFFNFDANMALMIDIFNIDNNISLPNTTKLIESMLALRSEDKKVSITHKQITTAHMLVLGGNQEILLSLIKQRLHFNQPDHKGLTPLHWAAIYNQKDSLELLISALTDIDQKCHEGNTALYYAVANNHWENTVCLLAKNADLFTENKAQISPIKSAIIQSHNELLSKLIGCRYLTKDTIDQFKLLHFAIKHEQFTVVKLFLEAEADISVQDHLKRTAFHLLIESDQHRLLKKILEQQVDFTLKDFSGNNAIHLAVKKNITEVIRAAKNNIALNEPNLRGRKPIHAAIEDNKLDMVAELILAGANLNAQDEYGNTPLQLAVNNNLNDMVSLLLENGAEPPNKSHRQSHPPYL